MSAILPPTAVESEKLYVNRAINLADILLFEGVLVLLLGAFAFLFNDTGDKAVALFCVSVIPGYTVLSLLLSFELRLSCKSKRFILGVLLKYREVLYAVARIVMWAPIVAFAVTIIWFTVFPRTP